MKYSTLSQLLLFTSLPYNLYATTKDIKTPKHDKTIASTSSTSPDPKKNTAATPEKKQTHKKKIVIFFSKGGACHLIARDHLKALLSNEYEIAEINPLQDLLGSIDPIRTITFGNLDCEDLFNKIQKNRWIGFGNWLFRSISPTLILSRRKTIEKKITAYLQKEKPDLLLSVIPCIDRAAANSAQLCNIPFLFVTLDSDLTMWSLGLHKITHPNYAITISPSIKLTLDQLKKRNIPTERIHPIGFPTRSDFFASHDKNAIYKEWNIPKNKFTILLLMGGAGSYSTYSYAKRIVAMPINAHLLVCTGRNEAIAAKVKKLKCTPGVSMTIVPFTKKIADLMSVSNLFITKPGPGSINEAVQMKLPMIVDNTSPVMFWETPNITSVEEHGWGTALNKFRDLKPMIKKFIEDKEYYAGIKKNLKKAPPYIFDKKIKTIIKDLIKNQAKITAAATTKKAEDAIKNN